MRWKAVLRGLFMVAATVLFIGCLLAILITGPVVVRTQRVEIDMGVSVERLRHDVKLICSAFSPRSYRQTGNLDRTAEWIAEQFLSAGLQVEV